MSKGYFAAAEAAECASVLLGRADQWMNNLESNGYLQKLKNAWAAYHGAYYSDVTDGHQISFSGAEGELVNLPINHLRNLAQHTHVITTSTRPAMEARAVNTDYKSQTQTILANGLLDYYMREKRLEKYLKTAVEYAIVMGSGFIKMGWNATSGEVIEFNEETNTPIYQGDVVFQNLSPFDVVVDPTKEHQDHDWVLCRSWKNRYDLAAKYPELEAKIMAVPTKSQLDRRTFLGMAHNETEDVAVFEFYHQRTEALPDGRYLLFLSDDAILYDGALPYRSLPVFRISPSDILGTPYGYTTVFDLLPLQEAINSLYSTVLTNQNAFGVQNILVPRGADIAISELAGGLNVIEANLQAGKPEALNLTQTPPEVFKMIEQLERTAETLSGVNQVARGNPEASLKSGSALALIQSMSIQFLSGLQASYVALIEDVGTALIQMLRDYAAVPRIAAIVGRTNKTDLKEFKGDDLSSISRVICDVANPLSRTIAGRVEMARDLLQMGVVKNATDYFTVMNTGRLDALYEETQRELLLIRGENEKLMDGQQVPVLAIDDHRAHMMSHKAILNDPDLRQDGNLVEVVTAHIQQHIQALRTTDPDLLQLLGQQPLPPQPPPGAGPGGPPPPGAPGPGPGGPPPGPMPGPMQAPPPPGAPNGPKGGAPSDLLQQAAPNMPIAGMPRIPSPPAPFQHLPVNPAMNIPK